MGTNCAPLVADLFLFCYERDFMMSLSDDKQADIIDACKTTFRCLDDFLYMNNFYLDKMVKGRKGAKIGNRYNQAPHLTQDTNGKMTISQLDIKGENQEVSLFPASDHKAPINRRTQKHNKNKTEKQNWSTKEALPWNGQKI